MHIQDLLLLLLLLLLIHSGQSFLLMSTDYPLFALHMLVLHKVEHILVPIPRGSQGQ